MISTPVCFQQWIHPTPPSSGWLFGINAYGQTDCCCLAAPCCRAVSLKNWVNVDIDFEQREIIINRIVNF